VQVVVGMQKWLCVFTGVAYQQIDHGDWWENRWKIYWSRDGIGKWDATVQWRHWSWKWRWTISDPISCELTIGDTLHFVIDRFIGYGESNNSILSFSFDIQPTAGWSHSLYSSFVRRQQSTVNESAKWCLLFRKKGMCDCLSQVSATSDGWLFSTSFWCCLWVVRTIPFSCDNKPHLHHFFSVIIQGIWFIGQTNSVGLAVSVVTPVSITNGSLVRCCS